MDYSNRHMDPLGVNQIGRNIKKSPVHQPNFGNTRAQPPTEVYNISKNDFRNIVQQLTGSPSQHKPSRFPQNSSKNPNPRLQRIRPAPLMQMNRPQIPIHPHLPPQPSGAVHSNNNFVRPPPPPPVLITPTQTDVWPNAAESPISAYMHYLQTSVIDLGPKQTSLQPSFGFLPNPPIPSVVLSSPRVNSPPLLPSPTSQFLLPSPTGFLNLFSPRSPYPLLSPGIQHLPPPTPISSFSPMGKPGILGPGPHPPLSPGYGFPLSPGFLFPISSPRWRDQ